MKLLPVSKMYVLLIMLILSFTMACKKESNDPNIDDRTINKTFTATASGGNFSHIDSLDIDADGLNDMIFQNAISTSDSVEFLVIQFYNAKVLIEKVDFLGGLISTNKPLAAGTSIDASSTSWQEVTYSSYNSKKTTLLADIGIHGKGDQYFAFQLKKSTVNSLYGWLKVNLSDDHKTFIIKEVAVQKVINKSIKVGEK